MCNRKKGDEVISGVKFTLFSQNSIQWDFELKHPKYQSIELDKRKITEISKMFQTSF
jgi:hypothetical protein